MSGTRDGKDRAMTNDDADILLAIEKAPGWRPWDDAAHARAKAMEADGLVKECGIAAMPPHVVYCITRKGEDALLKHCAENF